MLQKRLVPFITLVCLSTVSCSSIRNSKIPWIAMMHPANFIEDARRCTTVEVNASVRAQLPYLPASFATVEFLRDRAIVTIRPPYDTDEVSRYYREELERRGYAVTFNSTGKE